MKIMYKHLILGVASLGLVLVGGATTSAQAASKTAKLPSSLKGTWYGYLGKDDDQGNYYMIAKFTVADKKITAREYISAKKQLTPKTWYGTVAIPTTYTKKAKGVYRAHSRISVDQSTLWTLSRKTVTVKTLHQKRSALKIHIEGDNYYAFRRPLRSHTWDY